MRLDEGLGDGETEAGAGVVVPAGEQPEDLVAPTRIDARSVIGHGKLDHARRDGRGADQDRGNRGDSQKAREARPL